MYKNRKRLQQIIRQYIAGRSTSDEREFLDAYDDLFTANKSEAANLSDEERGVAEKRIEQNVFAIINQHEKKVVRLWPRVAAAAVILIFLSGAAYFILSNRKPVQPLTAHNQVTIKPGTNKAILTLSNGQQIVLSQQKNGQIASQKGMNILKAANGQISYVQGETNVAASANAAPVINTVSTPNGGQYQVTLPDGTRVWLNAASSLSFAVTFEGAADREVNLKGEAYFEVTKDKEHPFIVKTADQQVQVYGTHFNINAYHDVPATITTLLEGSVKVTAGDGQNAMFLAPDQQSALKGDEINIKNVIGEDAIAWKEGYFRFDNERLAEALKKISRWYNVGIVYKDEELKNKIVYGTMSRFSNITDVVQLLELTRSARFEIHDDKIYVLNVN